MGYPLSKEKQFFLKGESPTLRLGFKMNTEDSWVTLVPCSNSTTMFEIKESMAYWIFSRPFRRPWRSLKIKTCRSHWCRSGVLMVEWLKSFFCSFSVVYFFSGYKYPHKKLFIHHFVVDYATLGEQYHGCSSRFSSSRFSSSFACRDL